MPSHPQDKDFFAEFAELKRRIGRLETRELPAAGGGGTGDPFSYARFRGPNTSDDMLQWGAQNYTDWSLFEPGGVVTGDGYAVHSYATGGTPIPVVQVPGPGLYAVSWSGISYVNPQTDDQWISLVLGILPAPTTDQARDEFTVPTFLDSDGNVVFDAHLSGIIWVPDDSHYIAPYAQGAEGFSTTGMPYAQRHYLNVAKVGNGA